jgi:predicted  nucleic acid-binding Zn-ribbon protein
MPFFGYYRIDSLIEEIEQDIKYSVQEIIDIEKEIPNIESSIKEYKDKAEKTAIRLLKVKNEEDKEMYSERSRHWYEFLTLTENELEKMHNEIPKIKKNIGILEQSKRVLIKVSLRFKDLQESSRFP